MLHTQPDAATATAARRSWRADLHAWREQMTTLAGWHYPLRLGSCMVAAEILAHLQAGPHSYWILLTVVIVVQRDHTAALTRTLQRAVGTALGVLLGALLINATPIWATVALIAVIGAVRVHLKVANYAAYTLVMTPLVTVISGLGGPISSALLWERLIDTVLGCLISVLLGYLVWRRVRWTE
ncbi:MAG TPA: FUSC family protein [Candidatus Nanopelagicales bacterium]|nr:FUSC family protein [Candidatus Nanopelagicales bacterium]